VVVGTNPNIQVQIQHQFGMNIGKVGEGFKPLYADPIPYLLQYSMKKILFYYFS